MNAPAQLLSRFLAVFALLFGVVNLRADSTPRADLLNFTAHAAKLTTEFARISAAKAQNAEVKALLAEAGKRAAAVLEDCHKTEKVSGLKVGELDLTERYGLEETEALPPGEKLDQQLVFHAGFYLKGVKDEIEDGKKRKVKGFAELVAKHSAEIDKLVAQVRTLGKAIGADLKLLD